MTKEGVLEKLDLLGKDRHWLAQNSNYDYRTVNNKLGPSGKISGRMMEAFERVILEEEARGRIDLNKEDLSIWDLVMFSGLEIKTVIEGQKIGGYSKLEDLYHDAVMDFCDDLIAQEKKVVSLKPQIDAAAGQPIGADIIDWEGEPTVNVRVRGLSMIPKFDDGEVIEMQHKSQARSPWMKKGLIYLVEYDGGYTVKVYNTRLATEEELNEEYSDHGKVKVLQSLNPEHPEIVIKQPLEWIAWFEG